MRPRLISVVGWATAGVIALVLIINDDVRNALPEALRGSPYWILGSASGFALFWGVRRLSRALRPERTPADR
ncbi:hypothetical protein IWC96_05095 [Brevundimonas sp. BAL450]|uniref:hypothetical protein n=1 Tax=Brevundimonas sp. BAL450 TaxID=1708162 RepID=UPI0018C9BB85|nr:hypothetical protein [Brevundimonas sp. BAL450]MBG7614657.1 hypothetical protein [Brevundimonas sp. BAL450]